jgi:hypothetical protein
MTFPLPTGESIVRIQSFGEKGIVEFFDEVSFASMQNLLPYLPAVHGFRKESQAGVQQIKKTLARRILTSSKERFHHYFRDYRALYHVWRAWASERLGDSEGINDLIDSIEEFEDSREHHDSQNSYVNNAHIATLFATLKQWSQENRCSREQIERLFAFSPFANSPEIAKSISESKSRQGVDREAAFTAMPDRVQQVEQEIQSFKTQIRTIIARIDAIATSLEQANTDQRLGELVKSVETIQKTVADEHASLAEDARTLQGAIDAQESGLSVLRGTIKDQTEKLDELSRSISAIQTAAQDYSVRSTEQLLSLLNEISSLKTTLTEVAAKQQKPEWFDGIETRVNAFGSRPAVDVTAATAGTAPRTVPDSGAASSVASLRLERLIGLNGTAPRSLETPAAITRTLASNFQTMGLKNTSAEIFAGEVCAAILCRQAVFFKGAFASEMARLCAQTLSGPKSYRVSLPIGLDDGELLRAAFWQGLGKPADSISAVAIEGVNRSALDLFEDVLADALSLNIHTAVECQPRAFVFASIIQGLASLSIEPNYLELGPIFDLDCLDWRSRSPGPSSPLYGVTPSTAYERITAATAATQTDVEEPQRLLKEFRSKRNPRIERNMLSAYVALSALHRSKGDPSPLQSLFYGWMLPLLAAMGLSKEHVDSELAGGVCDGKVADKRLVSLLSEFPSPDGSAP